MQQGRPRKQADNSRRTSENKTPWNSGGKSACRSLLIQRPWAASHIFIDGAPADDGAHHPALQARLVERGILALRLEPVGVEYPGDVDIDHDHVGRCARLEASARE